MTRRAVRRLAACAPAALSILIAAAVPGPAVAAPAAATITVRYETNLEGDPPLERPVTITLDGATGQLCVTDDGTRTLVVFDDRGLARFRTDPALGLRSPRGGSLDARGGFVFTDADPGGGRTIRRLNFLGEPEPYEPVRPRDPWQPTHLLIVRDGHYVTLGRTGLLSKHHSDTGELLWSHQVSDPDWERADLLGRPAEAPDGTLYVPHGGLGAVLAVGADGAPTGEFGASGTKRGELAFPVAVAVGTGGNVLVLDRVRHAVLVYGPDRRYRTEFGHVGYSPGDFYHPLGLAAAADGRTWVAQGFEGRVQQFRLQLAD